MKYKIVIGLFVLVILFLSEAVHIYYSSTVSQQATINDMRGRVVVAWAHQMFWVSFYLRNATTNIDVERIRGMLSVAVDIGDSTSALEVTLYFEIAFTPDQVQDHIAPYTDGYPFVKRISSSAIEVIRNLAQKISDVAGLIINVEGALIRDGIDPVQLLEETSVLDDILNGLAEIRTLSEEVYDFSPKF